MADPTSRLPNGAPDYRGQPNPRGYNSYADAVGDYYGNTGRRLTENEYNSGTIPGYSPSRGTTTSPSTPPTPPPVYGNTGVLPYNARKPYTGTEYGDKTQGQSSNVNQIPVNVLDVNGARAGGAPSSQGLNYGLADVLNNYYSRANDYLTRFSPQSSSNPGGFALPSVSGTTGNLNTNFLGADSLNSALSGGIDYFGRQGISEGINNINAQRNSSNAAISNSLGRTAGNSSLIDVLQHQNNLQSRLAGQPLISEAQQGTYQRALGNIGLQNEATTNQNQAQLLGQGFNLQSILSGLNAQTQGVQPLQNLLDTLTTLQGQQRGVTSSESQVGSRNFS